MTGVTQTGLAIEGHSSVLPPFSFAGPVVAPHAIHLVKMEPPMSLRIQKMCSNST